MLFTLCEYSILIQDLGVSLFIFSLANHAAVLTVITHPGIQSDLLTLFSIVRSVFHQFRISCILMMLGTYTAMTTDLNTLVNNVFAPNFFSGLTPFYH